MSIPGDHDPSGFGLGFQVAQPREFIERMPHDDGMINLSVSGRFDKPDITKGPSIKIPGEENNLLWMLSKNALTRQERYQSRLLEVEAPVVPGENLLDASLTNSLPSVVCRNTDELFPVLMEMTNTQEIWVDRIGYPLPIWNRDGYLSKPMDRAIAEIEGTNRAFEVIEGPIRELIKNSEKLPDKCKAVYLDYPSVISDQNYYTNEELLYFIKNHPNVQFFVDQANGGFSTRVFDFGLIVEDYPNLVVMNSTSKLYAESIIAYATMNRESGKSLIRGFKSDKDEDDYATLELELPGSKSVSEEKSPDMILVSKKITDDDWIRLRTCVTTDLARLTNRPEEISYQQDYRDQVIKNRQDLLNRLANHFGPTERYKFQEVIIGGQQNQGGHLILNARRIAELNSPEIQDNYGGWLEGVFRDNKILVKNCRFYGAPDTKASIYGQEYPLKDLIYLAIPTDVEEYDALLAVFSKIFEPTKPENGVDLFSSIVK